MKVNFIYKPLREELLPQNDVNIIKTLELNKDSFLDFMNNPLNDHDFIKPYSAAMSFNPETQKYNSILISCSEFNFAFVIHSSGYSYGRYVAYVPKCVIEVENER